jgi:hyperosmotically inducible periplasmic protein
MFGALARLILIVVVLVAAAAFFLGYRWNSGNAPAERPVATTGVDTERARDAGARVGETVAVGANRAQQAVDNAAMTTKIKAKMTLDDLVEAARIDVDTNSGVVTLSGTVRSEAERTRALQLARETEGVTSVVDRLTIAR